MLFYDFEVFKNNWLVVIIDPEKKRKYIIVDDNNKLEDFYNENKNKIWIG